MSAQSSKRQRVERIGTEKKSIPFPTGDDIRTRIGLLLFGTLLAIILTEVVVRTIEPHLHPEHWRDRPLQSYMPESTPDNRNFPFTAKKPPGTFRIIVVGDSFTFAGKVHFDDNFVARLQRMLNLNVEQPKVEVLNWGVPGFSTPQEANLIRTAMNGFEPDLILLQVTLNDPEIDSFGKLHDTVQARREAMLGNWFVVHWKTLGLLVNRYYNHLQNNEYLSYHLGLFSDRKTWKRFSAAVDRIATSSQSHKIPVLPVIFPMFSHPFNTQYPFTAIHQQLREKFESDGMHALDLLDSFHDIPPERLQAIPGEDAHPNEIAHRIAADTIYSELVRAELIPAKAVVRKLRPGGRHLPQIVFEGKIPVDSDNDAEAKPPQPVPDAAAED